MNFRNRQDARGDRILLLQKFGSERISFAASLRRRSWYRNVILIGFKTTQKKNTTAQETMKCFQKLLPPNHRPCFIHADNSLGFLFACEDLCWNLDTSTTYISETNGFADNTARNVKEGTSAVLVQSRFRKVMERSDGMLLCCYLRNVLKQLADRKSPYGRRFGTPSDCPMIPFWAEIDCWANLHERQEVVFINLVQRCFQEDSSDTRWILRRLDRKLDHRGLARHWE